MNDGDVFDGASPGPSPGLASSTTTQMPSSMQAGPSVVRVPGRIMLDLLLEQIGFPAAKYSRRRYLNNQISFTILFWTSVRNDGFLRTQMTVTGVRSSNEAAAEDSATLEAIRIIENATNTVVKDLNFSRLNRMERDFGYLRLRLNESFDMIAKLAKGYLRAVKFMNASSDQLHSVIVHAFPPTRMVDSLKNEGLNNVERIAHDLREEGNSLGNKLYVLRKQIQEREHEMFAPIAFFKEAQNHHAPAVQGINQRTGQVNLPNNFVERDLMSDKVQQNQGSPGSASYTNSPLTALAQTTTRVFRIPHRLVLDMLLQNLGLPPAQYQRVVNDGKILVTILLSATRLDDGESTNDVTVPGEYCTDDETAEDTAALRAVGYIECTTNTVVRDVNYEALKRQRAHAESLQCQLKESDSKNKMLARGWLLASY